MSLRKYGLQLLFPEKCVLCRSVLKWDEMDLCRKCRLEAPECLVSRRKIPFVDSWVAVWYYEKDARRSLLRYKFGRKRSYAAAYGRLLAMKLQREYPDGFDRLTWVPTGKWKKLTRGFDQCQLLAQVVGQELGMEPEKLIRKIRNNRTQSTIHGEAKRRANVLGAYKVTDPQRVAGQKVLLLDDIITTGATAGECGRILLTAGAAEVHCGAVASVRHKAKSSR